ncbi:MAG: hypothetical protein ABIV63_04405 [Caldimonas sp.]
MLPVGFALAFLRFGEVLYRLLTGKHVRLLGDEAEDALKLGDGPIDATPRPPA